MSGWGGFWFGLICFDAEIVGGLGLLIYFGVFAVVVFCIVVGWVLVVVGYCVFVLIVGYCVLFGFVLVWLVVWVLVFVVCFIRIVWGCLFWFGLFVVFGVLVLLVFWVDGFCLILCVGLLLITRCLDCRMHLAYYICFVVCWFGLVFVVGYCLFGLWVFGLGLGLFDFGFGCVVFLSLRLEFLCWGFVVCGWWCIDLSGLFCVSCYLFCCLLTVLFGCVVFLWWLSFCVCLCLFVWLLFGLVVDGLVCLVVVL